MTKRPHILLMITRAERGGAQTHVSELFALRRQAHLTVASGEDGFLLDEARALGLETVIIPDLMTPLNFKSDLRALWAIWRLLRRLRPDLIHLHSSKAGLLGRVSAWLAGIPAVFTAHGWAFTEGASPSRRTLALWSERFAAPLSAAIIAVSDYDRKLGERLNVTHKAHTIHNALPDLGRVPDRPPQDSRRIRVLMVARFAPPKDQALLVRAAATLPEIELWLIGDGEARCQVTALSAELGLRDRVHFLGNRADVNDLLMAGDVFCLVSHYEGFPISILEAMRAGLPVLASDVGGVKEAVVDGQTGLLVAYNDVVSWRLALARIVDHPEWRRAMGEAGRARFESEFTLPGLLHRTWAVYDDILRRHNHQQNV